ncbi:PhzF family phenazine biosynthesis protein [bacterium]|nr:MAG: PhzF family phenazine biosynthesis protein [bacterium]
MIGIPIFTVDAFTGRIGARELRGNPAAVVVLDEPKEEDWMLAVAAEMNLSETAFVRQLGSGHYSLRWFTPTDEVNLCGHATLATAHVLWESQMLSTNEAASFETRSGILQARKQDDRIELDFPAQKVQIAAAPRGLAMALGIEPRFPISCWKAEDDWLLEVPVGLVENLKPHFGELAQICRFLKCRGIIVTAATDSEEYDFISRFFGPAIGVDEDPVTGSAHTKLAPFWGKQLKKTQMVGYQASVRGGLVAVDWRDSRVGLLGAAHTFLAGQLRFKNRKPLTLTSRVLQLVKYRGARPWPSG